MGIVEALLLYVSRKIIPYPGVVRFMACNHQQFPKHLIYMISSFDRNIG
jgi:hypothetical protein